MKRTVVLSADDFGRSHERNEAIDYAFKNDLIKSAALLVNSKYTDEAVSMAKRGNYLNKLHCHFNLCSGEISGFSKPVNEDFKNNAVFCVNKDFKAYHSLKLLHQISPVNYKSVLNELNSQYERFNVLTEGKGNKGHVDFHLYYNLNFSIALAYRIFCKKNNIKTARIIGEHHLHSASGKIVLIRNIVAQYICKSSKVKSYKACNIDYYVSNFNKYKNSDSKIELYVHPDLTLEGVQDNSISVYGHSKKLLQENIDTLKDYGCSFISW